jgi:membrane-bound lytic murein transglycosylase D
MPETAQAMGLEVNDEVDERFDPEKATRAMCRYVKQVKGYVGDWVSVTAAYNVGHGSLLRSRGAQRRRSFFDLHLNAQTTAHVYRAMAVKELMENRHQYKKLARYNHQAYVPVKTVNVEVTKDIPDLVAFAQAHGVTYTLVLPAEDPLAQPAPDAQPDSLPVLKAGVTLL